MFLLIKFFLLGYKLVNNRLELDLVSDHSKLDSKRRTGGTTKGLTECKVVGKGRRGEGTGKKGREKGREKGEEFVPFKIIQLHIFFLLIRLFKNVGKQVGIGFAQ
jgi:hypothetical protein